jgi:hypothetical protein
VLARVQGIRAAQGRRLRRITLPLTAALATLVLAAPPAGAHDPIVPLAQIHAGLHCTALTVVQGTTISSFDVDVLDVIADTDGTGARILVRVSGPAVDATGVAEGFSGSPVYCPDANGQIGNAGAISATVGQYGEQVALVTPIEAMLGIPVRPPSSVRSAPKLLRSARALAAPLVVSGLAPPLARLLERAAAAKGRELLAAPAGPAGAFPPQALVPGASMSVLLSSGTLAAGAIGTVTYRDGATLYGFGHPLEGAGRRALLLGDAYVYTVIGNPLDLPQATSYKLAVPGHPLGTLSDDALDGVVGSVGPIPASIPVTVRVRDRDRHRTLVQRTQVADETDVGNPDGGSALSALAPLAVAQAVAVAFDGAPADETGGLCLDVRVRESRLPLSLCNRYVVSGGGSGSDGGGDGLPPLAMTVASDVGDALSTLDAARFAPLHVTSLTANLSIARGLRLATILDARGPRVVRAGHTAPIALRVRVVRGPLRTIRFRIAIPSDVRPGTHALHLAGTPEDGQDGGSDGGSALAALLGGGGPDSGPPPAQSMAELAATFAEVATFDGVNARLGDDRWPAYRDPRLRLDGDATLLVRVAKRGR